MNAAAMVSLARNWTLVPDKTICQLAPSLIPRGATLRGESLPNLSGQNLGAASAQGEDGSVLNMTAAGGQVLSLKFVVTDDSCAVKQLEHVQVRRQLRGEAGGAYPGESTAATAASTGRTIDRENAAMHQLEHSK
jgi:hypothetical protein